MTTRQAAAARVILIVAITVLLLALIAGGTEIALHGTGFFVCRSTGTGETGPHGLSENQCPGQPDAPHVKVILHD